MPDVHAVLFDYGLVLTGLPDPGAWASMKQTLGMDEASFYPAYWRPRLDYDRGALTGAAYWTAVAGRALAPRESESLLRDDTLLWTQPNQPMIDWAARLQSAGVKTGILSNLGDALEAGVREQCRWLGDFTHHTFSHRLRTAKPDPAIYRHAAEGLAERPENILFIDDREDNIAGAIAADMQAIRYTEHHEFLQTLRERGLAGLLFLAAPADEACG